MNLFGRQTKTYNFIKILITDRVRSTRGGNIFSLSVSSHLGGGIYLLDDLGGGVPTLMSGW